MELTAHPDGIEVAVHDPNPQLPRMRTPDLIGGTGGFGRPMVNHLARTTAVTPGPSGGKTVSALLPGSAAAGGVRREGPPTHLRIPVARTLQGTLGIPETGGMQRVPLADVGA
ncbi:hypothetical protein [Streptomyces sp. NPDC006463]|uniref:hypothetical protein n=1 Tax=Streptomyces sp. NPDC006463 TaxID=3364746 RepID=UPI00367701E6